MLGAGAEVELEDVQLCLNIISFLVSSNSLFDYGYFLPILRSIMNVRLA